MLSLLPQELRGIILAYLCPTEDVDALHVLHTKFKNSLVDWTKSLEITTYDIFWKCKLTRVNGKLHRCDDKPAMEYDDGDKKWYTNNKCHRENDKAAIECMDGTKEWWVNGEIHREIDDKPAIELFSGTKYWVVHGKHHRTNDKPAIEYFDGTKYWYTDGILTKSVKPNYSICG